MSEDDFSFLDLLEVLGSYILRNQEYKLETNLLRLVARAALKAATILRIHYRYPITIYWSNFWPRSAVDKKICLIR